MIYIKKYWIPLLFVILVSCGKDETQGKDSLEGVWSVTEIESFYADFEVDESGVVGFDEPERKLESGDLGIFNFNSSQVSYNFTRNDTLYSGSGSWELKLEKVNSGFVKTNKWTLNVANDFIFDVRFEDQTSNAEKNANSVEFDNWPKTSGEGVAIFMKLEKQ